VHLRMVRKTIEYCAKNLFTHSWYVQVNLGAVLQSASGSTAITIDQPLNPDIYKQSNFTNSLAFGIEGGYERQRNTTDVAPRILPNYLSAISDGLTYLNKIQRELKNEKIQCYESSYPQFGFIV
jgi:hypothetical protein